MSGKTDGLPADLRILTELLEVCLTGTLGTEQWVFLARVVDAATAALFRLPNGMQELRLMSGIFIELCLRTLEHIANNQTVDLRVRRLLGIGLAGGAGHGLGQVRGAPGAAGQRWRIVVGREQARQEPTILTGISGRGGLQSRFVDGFADKRCHYCQMARAPMAVLNRLVSDTAPSDADTESLTIDGISFDEHASYAPLLEALARHQVQPSAADELTDAFGVLARLEPRGRSAGEGGAGFDGAEMLRAMRGPQRLAVCCAQLLEPLDLRRQLLSKRSVDDFLDAAESVLVFCDFVLGVCKGSGAVAKRSTCRSREVLWLWPVTNQALGCSAEKGNRCPAAWWLAAWVVCLL